MNARTLVTPFLLLVAVGCGGGGGAGDDDVVPDAGGDVACRLPASCPAVSAECLSLVDNTDQDAATLRIAQLDVIKPATLGTGLVASVLGSGSILDLGACFEQGTGTLSWLLAWDHAAGTVRVGAARPVTDPTQGYAFMDETLDGVPVAPAQLDAPVGGDGTFAAITGVDVVLPAFLDAGGTSAVTFPFHELTVQGTMSADRSCIGGLEPTGLSASCEPAQADDPFATSASMHAYILLEDADTIVIAPLNESLCVLLSGDPATYGDGGSPQRCKRTTGIIDFQGDWCAATNSTGCTDSVEFSADFAASGVQLD
jgi:hypothetical protein